MDKLTLMEQEKIKETMATEGAKILFSKLAIVAEQTKIKEQQADPFKNPEAILKARQLRYLINILIPSIINGYINYDPEAIDEQLAPEDKWDFQSWLNQPKAGKDKKCQKK